MVSVKLVNHLDFNKILYKHQYGFQKGKSTEHNLIQALNYIGNAFNENKYCIGVFFVLKKAFDVCSHFKKLPPYSLPLEWNNAGNLVFYDNKVTFKHALREQLFSEILD